jgi:hypothetical protein
MRDIKRLGVIGDLIIDPSLRNSFLRNLISLAQATLDSTRVMFLHRTAVRAQASRKGRVHIVIVHYALVNSSC